MQPFRHIRHAGHRVNQVGEGRQSRRDAQRQPAPAARVRTALAHPARMTREIGLALSDGMALAYRKTEGAGWEAQADGAGNAEIETRKR